MDETKATPQPFPPRVPRPPADLKPDPATIQALADAVTRRVVRRLQTQPRVRVGFLAPEPTDSTSLYRAWGPLSHLARKLSHSFDFYPVEKAHWASLNFYSDILFLQRPYTDQHLRLVNLARSNGIPVWVDYDDNLFHVPRHNPAHAIYEKAKENMAKIAAQATVVTVSTPELAKEFTRPEAPLCRDVRVVPNALMDNIFGHFAPLDPSPLKVAVWRGSPTHDRDMMLYRDQIRAAVQGRPDWSFVFIGSPCHFVVEDLPKNCIISPPLDPLAYFELLVSLRPSLMMVPLEDSLFNRCKSNIAYVEGAFAGAAALVPDLPEWRRPGTIPYTSPEDFGQKLNHALENPTVLKEKGILARDHVHASLSIERVNGLRAQVLRDLVQGSAKLAGILDSQAEGQPLG